MSGRCAVCWGVCVRTVSWLVRVGVCGVVSKWMGGEVGVATGASW